MKINARQDNSYLFSGMINSSGAASGVSDLAGLVSDYNTIKNGSYNKLVSAYYKKMGEDGKTASGTTRSTRSADDVLNSLVNPDKSTKEAEDKKTGSSEKGVAEKKQYAGIATDAANLKTATEALSVDARDNLFAAKTTTTRGEDGQETTTTAVDRDRINAAVSDFVDKYNATVASSGEAKNSTVASRAQTLRGLGSEFGGRLKDIGITVGTDGKLSLDSDRLAAADTGSIRSVFNGIGSFGDRTEAAATMLKSGATSASLNTGSGYSSGGGKINYYDTSSLWHGEA